MRVLFVALALAIAATADELPEGTGKADVLKVCNTCHGVDTMMGEARTPSQWNDTVNDMVSRGATATDEELRRIVQYLAKAFPAKPTKVNVNTAPAKDLETKLEFTATESEALVQYRDKNGKFQALDDLKKVPGVDIKKIEAKKDRFAF